MSRVIRPRLAEMGRRMQARREEHKWSQTEMITRLEAAGIEWAGSKTMSRAAYSHWETGRADVPSSALVTLADVLQVSVGYLTGEQSAGEWQDELAMQFYNGMALELKPTALATLKTLFEASDRLQTTYGRKPPEDTE